MPESKKASDFGAGLLIACIVVLLLNCPTECTIYGSDNRIEAYQVKNELMTGAGRSAGVLMHVNALKDLKNGTFKLIDSFSMTDYVKKAYGYQPCESSRFQNQPAPGICSTVLLRPDLVATASHCISVGSCHGTIVVFDFEYGSSQAANKAQSLIVKKENRYRCEELLADSLKFTQYMDYAVFRLDRNVTNRSPIDRFVEFSSVIPNQKIFSVGSPLGVPLKWESDAQIDHVYSTDGVDNGANLTFSFRANLDSFEGQAGAPVFDTKSGGFIGILITGSVDFLFNKGCMEENVCISPNSNPKTLCRGEFIQSACVFAGFVNKGREKPLIKPCFQDVLSLGSQCCFLNVMLGVLVVLGWVLAPLS